MALPLILSQFISGIFLLQSLATVANRSVSLEAALIIMSTALATNFNSQNIVMILGLVQVLNDA